MNGVGEVATFLATTKAEQTAAALRIVALRQQQLADQGLVAMLEQAAAGPPAPSHQGQQVDIRA